MADDLGQQMAFQRDVRDSLRRLHNKVNGLGEETAAVKAVVKTLAGNGQPGRIGLLEVKVDEHKKELEGRMEEAAAERAEIRQKQEHARGFVAGAIAAAGTAGGLLGALAAWLIRVLQKS